MSPGNNQKRHLRQPFLSSSFALLLIKAKGSICFCFLRSLSFEHLFQFAQLMDGICIQRKEQGSRFIATWERSDG